MSFQTLSPELQNIFLVNHSYISKWFIFFVIIFLSIYYIFIVWPNHEPTIYFTQAIMRMFFYGLAFSFLMVSPLLVLVLSPEYNFYNFYNLIMKIYSVFISIVFILIFVDGLKLGILYILGKAGLDIANDHVQDVIKAIDHNKHFLKFVKWRNFKK